jgi:hypothetical protein
MRPKWRKEQKPAHRPTKPVDWVKADLMLCAGCPGTEIAHEFDMHPVTFYERVEKEKHMSFTEYCALKRKSGENSIRLAQFKKAVELLDNTMLIWLGKQRLDQREPQALEKNSTPLNDLQITALLNALHAVVVIPDAVKQ